MKKMLSLAAACAFASAAHAHVTLEYQVATAASSYKASFKVGHGCGASPTRQLIVQVPEAMQGAHPMPKPGWTITLQKAGERVTQVTWTARTDADKLPSDFYDEFVLVSRTPEQPGPVYWPVVQVCDEGRGNWTEVPSAGGKLADLKSPAAVLEVLPSEGGAAHHH